MSKRKLHAIILIFTAVAVLSSAAVCNLCGISPGSSTDEDQDGQATATTQETTTATTDTTPDGSEAAPQNNAPKITEVFLDDENMTDFLKTETLPARYEQNFYYFTIIAEDEDGDEMDFDIESTHGIVSDITRLANDSVAFTWESPENTEGSDTPLSVQIDVTVSDTAGGNDTFTIVIALLPVEGERTDEETRIDFEILADSSLSGYIIKDTQIRTGVILVGDWDNNKQIKGYLSFDISELSAIPGFEVISAKLVFDHINKSGSPELVGEKIDFKSFDYGESLDEADFAVGGDRIITLNASEFISPVEISNGSLISQVQNSISGGNSRFQVKIGLNGVTDNNNREDMFTMHSLSVRLIVTSFMTWTFGV